MVVHVIEHHQCHPAVGHVAQLCNGWDAIVVEITDHGELDLPVADVAHSSWEQHCAEHMPVQVKQLVSLSLACDRLPDAVPPMKHIDGLVVCTKQACFGQDVPAEGPLGPVGADLHQQQSEFPKCMNGIRLRSLFKKSQSVNFVAALLNALPKFLDSTDGSQRGLVNWLAPVLGTDLFEKCNYNCCLAPFLANGGCTVVHFRECWEHSVSHLSRHHPTLQHHTISQPT